MQSCKRKFLHPQLRVNLTRSPARVRADIAAKRHNEKVKSGCAVFAFSRAGVNGKPTGDVFTDNPQADGSARQRGSAALTERTQTPPAAAFRLAEPTGHLCPCSGKVSEWVIYFPAGVYDALRPPLRHGSFTAAVPACTYPIFAMLLSKRVFLRQSIR